MHTTARDNAALFFKTYFSTNAEPLRIVEIGAQDVNGSIRAFAPAGATYIGVDFVQAKGVDVVLDDPYQLPFETGSCDVVVSSSVFEHSELFWLLFLEIMRVLKPTGVFYLNAPSNGSFHRYPVDCWRFYPDAGQALVKWAQRSGMNPLLLESYTSPQFPGEVWNDYVAVYLRDAAHAERYPQRMHVGHPEFSNVSSHGSAGFANPKPESEDRMKLAMIDAIAVGRVRVV